MQRVLPVAALVRKTKKVCFDWTISTREKPQTSIGGRGRIGEATPGTSFNSQVGNLFFVFFSISFFLYSFSGVFFFLILLFSL
jgi:hypothetical protein